MSIFKTPTNSSHFTLLCSPSRDPVQSTSCSLTTDRTADMALEGKSALVTGAAMGIGRAIAETLLQNGAKVVLLDVNETAGKSLKEALDKQYGPQRTLFLNCDVESEEQVKAAFQEAVAAFGGIDVLCNNAGILNEAQWEKTVSINLVAVIRATYIALEHMNKLTGGRGGVVVNTASMAAAFQEAVAAFGGIDVLCNNAGILNEAQWEKTVSINLVAVIRATYIALEHMNKLTGGRGGVVVNTASMAGLGPLPSCPVYTATKHGVVGFTRAMAAASTASGYGIRFNALCPAFVQTDLLTNFSDKLGQFSQLAAETRTFVNVSDVAEGLLQLVTDETKNGAAFMVKRDAKKYMTFPVLS
ncbi:15-hydroxyprostaglandin dehydrogenase [NAD(+)]-like isoform X1 [Cebidichthys violaceus]|uniref:15-hydroxyprostaglandin dehydrogenase [NAD(+)]-like isoform X1 n=1 Tax=Cebidichthys violaceus TaxID=271503 RepID=UPI0035C9D957